MKTGDTIELKITDIGSNGEGIGHNEGYTVFIPFALPGETVRAKINYAKKTLAYATMTHKLEVSQDRVTPECPVYYRCGGCSLMHLKYEAQLEAKRNSLINILRKNCGYTGEVRPVVPSPEVFCYRNKIQLPFGEQNGKAVLGFYRQGTHSVVPINRCLLHGDWADKLIKIVSEFANANKIPVYDEASHKGLLRHLVARFIGGALTVTLVTNGDRLKAADLLVSALKAEFNNVSLYLSVNTAKTNVILGNKLIPIYAPKQTVNIQGVEVEINPMSFFQVNDGVRELIYNAVADAVSPQEGTTVIDAYSGVGVLGAILAKKGARIYNIEIVPEAIEDAVKLYAANSLASKATNICGDAAKVLPDLIPTFDNPTVILDPPRKGCGPAVLDALTRHPVRNLIYISCNPATLSRDLATLLSAYHIDSITPYDMFPHTQHVESVVLMSRVEK
ncbi:MAG: 23S rRNA (uracil(1939)-C(5))-methyltransferase RlmD [Clostridiales bacterium]|nr:23S rRNA (uracil(1939)-C(5))-methyltransferase RlmD [Clostridiales bacterium]